MADGKKRALVHHGILHKWQKAQWINHTSATDLHIHTLTR